METPSEYQFDSIAPTIHLIPPTFYLLKDVFSRMIVWMDLKAERPSWAYEMAAVAPFQKCKALIEADLKLFYFKQIRLEMKSSRMELYYHIFTCPTW